MNAGDASNFVSALLGEAVVFLLLMAAASMLALFKGASELRRLFRTNSSDYTKLLLKSPLVPGVSVLVMTRDFSSEARSLVRRLLDLHFGKHEVVLALDGISDEVRTQWVEELRLVDATPTVSGELPASPVCGYYVSREPLKLLVVETERRTDAGAFNAAINASQFPVLGMVDPRAEFVPEWLLYLVRPMLENWDKTTAVCAAAMPPPVPGIAGRIGALEMVRRWIVRGAAFGRWGRLVPMPGCCVLVKRDAVVAAGGFRRGLMELFLTLHKRKEGVAFLPTPVSWTKAPTSFADLREQTRYDQAQLAAGGRFVGLVSVRVFRPAVETLALLLTGLGLAFGWVHPALAALVVLASIGAGIVVSMATVVLREMADPGSRDPGYVARMFLAAIPENLGYRQVRNLYLIAGYLR